MPRTKQPKRPQIHMIDREADALSDLAVSVEARLPQDSALLQQEIDRARNHTENRIPDDVVTMHSTVEFVDEASGADRTVELVYPGEADISAGRISILTPVGAGLIGMRTGQSIVWPDRDGRERTLTIVKVVRKVPAL